MCKDVNVCIVSRAEKNPFFLKKNPNPGGFFWGFSVFNWVFFGLNWVFEDH